MRILNTSRLSPVLIYGGTFLISVLSFFTTYQGLVIFLDTPLAIIGSLGIQTAMLGIAWNLMRLKSHRLTYVAVFSIVAIFSVFFSYANFNSSLKGNTRAQSARAAYTSDARPVAGEYAAAAKLARSQGEYQVGRIADLIDMEQTKGWATVVDEGSNDPFIQSVIDGARRTVVSWEKNQGNDYRQGAGQGIIVNYLNSWGDRISSNVRLMEVYVGLVDSILMELDSDRPVGEQYQAVNYAAVRFPLSAYSMITSSDAELPPPPLTANYIETPANGQQALMLVIKDLYPMDRLTLFSLLFAIAIDLVVVAMALCGSHMIDDIDLVFSRLEKDASQRLRDLPLNDTEAMSASLRENIERMRKASEYSRDLNQVLEEHRQTRDSLILTRGPEPTGKGEGPKLLVSRSDSDVRY
ncbi:MAG: hypothetical protein GY867_11785 [bacterium]|nr:hypothetical protein [bacterium]